VLATLSTGPLTAPSTDDAEKGRRPVSDSPVPETPTPPSGTSAPETPGRVEFVHRSWPADPAQLSVIRRELSSWLAPLALSDDETADVVLAVDEAAANAVRHAYGPGRSGVVELTLWTEPGTLCVEVVDHGNWRPPATPTPRGEGGDSGRGMTLMSSMADAVLIHYDARGSRVLLRHAVPGAAGWDDDAAPDVSDAPDQARAPQPVPAVPGTPTPSGSGSRGSGVGDQRPPTGA
jgi:anti-sigma regulatory factor (Ser/Thr protein kinase)